MKNYRLSLPFLGLLLALSPLRAQRQLFSKKHPNRKTNVWNGFHRQSWVFSFIGESMPSKEFPKAGRSLIITCHTMSI